MTLNQTGRAPETRRDTSRLWRAIAMIAVVLALAIVALFASGLLNDEVKDGRSKADVSVKVAGRPMPAIALEAKQPPVGTMQLPVDVPAASEKSGAAAPVN